MLFRPAGKRNGYSACVIKTDIVGTSTPSASSNVSTVGEAAEVWRADERWLLVERIVASTGFQRAAQLRHILEHITRVTIEQPGTALREYEIACDVLGRRSTFDPTSDNIVRQQMSQLRRRLEQYYEENPREELRLTIPKGSYAPHFDRQVAAPVQENTPVVAHAVHTHGEYTKSKKGVTLTWPVFTVLAAVSLAAVLLALWLVRNKADRTLPVTSGSESGNAFVQYLVKANGPIMIVQPDLSLSIVQNALSLDLSAQDYSQPNFLSGKIAAVPDPALRDVLQQIGSRHATSVDEAAALTEIRDDLAARGKTTSIRFARDLHTRDLGDGNLVLIGSRRSDPWTLLFTKNTVFQFVSAGNGFYQYMNTQPQPGEQQLYVPYEQHDGNIASYVDVVFGPNLTKSGYALVINGSDAVANVAAARYLFRGKLRPDIVALLQKPDLSRFELFLRGSHAENEAEDTFELVSVRSSTN